MSSSTVSIVVSGVSAAAVTPQQRYLVVLRYATKFSKLLLRSAFFLLQPYFTDVWGLSITHAAYILMLWVGISKTLPVILLLFIDSVTEFWLTFLTSAANFTGIALCCISTPLVLANSTGECNYPDQECIGNEHKAVLFIGMALLAIGEAGDIMGEQLFHHHNNKQPDENEHTGTDEQDQIRCLKKWDKQRVRRLIIKVVLTLIATLVSTVLFIAVPYQQVWTVTFAVPAISAALITLLIVLKSAHLDRKAKVKSIATSVCRVLVARYLKSSQPFPQDDTQLYGYNDLKDVPLTKTQSYRGLEKAAISSSSKQVTAGESKDRWGLCSMVEVEETKLLIRMAPLFTIVLICGTVSSVGDTYFLEQADQMNRKVGSLNVPLPFLLVFIQCSGMLLKKLAEKLLNGKKMLPSNGILLGMTSSVLCCIVAALVERRRLKVVRDHGLLESPYDLIPMHVYWLLFQVFLLAGLDSFLEESVNAHFENHAPEHMVDYLCHLTEVALGLGSMFNMFLIFSIRHMGFDWFQLTLNMSRLDKYYWSLTVVSSAALIAFPFCIRRINKYMKPDQATPIQDEEAAHDHKDDRKNGLDAYTRGDHNV